MTETPHPYFDRHAETLDRALTAIRERAYWSAYPESPSPRVYGETAAADALPETCPYTRDQIAGDWLP